VTGPLIDQETHEECVPRHLYQRERGFADDLAQRADDVTADLRALRSIAEDVVTDYADKCCDHPADCSCSMARLVRFVKRTDDGED
jgi:hypothetical protein